MRNIYHRACITCRLNSSRASHLSLSLPIFPIAYAGGARVFACRHDQGTWFRGWKWWRVEARMVGLRVEKEESVWGLRGRRSVFRIRRLEFFVEGKKRNWLIDCCWRSWERMKEGEKTYDSAETADDSIRCAVFVCGGSCRRMIRKGFLMKKNFLQENKRTKKHSDLFTKSQKKSSFFAKPTIRTLQPSEPPPSFRFIHIRHLPGSRHPPRTAKPKHRKRPAKRDFPGQTYWDHPVVERVNLGFGDYLLEDVGAVIHRLPEWRERRGGRHLVWGRGAEEGSWGGAEGRGRFGWGEGSWGGRWVKKLPWGEEELKVGLRSAWFCKNGKSFSHWIRGVYNFDCGKKCW